MNSEDRTDHTVNCKCAICSDGSGYDDYETPTTTTTFTTWRLKSEAGVALESMGDG